jgi:hypothetical protein
MSEEDKIQASFVQWCETQDNIKFGMIPNEVGLFKRCPGFHAIVNQLIWTGLRKGVPDMLLVVNTPKGKKTIFIEFKKPGGVISQHQHKWIDSLRESGVPVFVCYSLKEAQEAIDSIVNIK